MTIIRVVVKIDCYLRMTCPGFFISAVQMVASNTSESTVVLTSENKSNKEFCPLATLK